MDLGLSNLSDDQLVELLQEACSEAATRDPVVREVAQAKIRLKADELKLSRASAQSQLLSVEAKERILQDAITAAVNACREKEVKELQKQIEAEIVKEIKAGKYRPLSPDDEVQKIVEYVKKFEDDFKQWVRSRREPSPDLRGLFPGGFEIPQNPTRKRANPSSYPSSYGYGGASSAGGTPSAPQDPGPTYPADNTVWDRYTNKNPKW